METSHIAYVRAIAELESISLAAERFGIGQATLSKTIIRLEQQLGVNLFVRSAHGTTLTLFGREFLEGGAAIERQVRDLETQASRHSGNIAGKLNLGAGSVSRQLFIPEILRRMHEAYPALRMRVQGGAFARLTSDLGIGALDMILAVLPEAADPGYVTRQTFAASVRVAARHGHPIFLRDGGRLSDILEFSWVGPLITATEPLTWPIARRFREEGLPAPRLAVEAGDHNLAVNMLRSTDLIGFLPEEVIALNSEDIAAYQCPALNSDVRLGLIWRTRQPLSPAAEAFMETAQAVCAEAQARQGRGGPVVSEG